MRDKRSQLKEAIRYAAFVAAGAIAGYYIADVVTKIKEAQPLDYKALKKELELAVADERYEDAARLRDKINSIG